jgi:hypothetical protein
MSTARFAGLLLIVIGGRERDQRLVCVDNRLLGVGPARLVAMHLEGVSVVDRMTLDQDALDSLGDGSAAERALEVVVLGEPAEHDVYGALPLLDVGVGDVGEDSALRGLLDEEGDRACGSGGLPGTRPPS